MISVKSRLRFSKKILAHSMLQVFATNSNNQFNLAAFRLDLAHFLDLSVYARKPKVYGSSGAIMRAVRNFVDKYLRAIA